MVNRWLLRHDPKPVDVLVVVVVCFGVGIRQVVFAALAEIKDGRGKGCPRVYRLMALIDCVRCCLGPATETRATEGQRAQCASSTAVSQGYTVMRSTSTRLVPVFDLLWKDGGASNFVLRRSGCLGGYTTLDPRLEV